MTIKQYNLYDSNNVFLKTIVMNDEDPKEIFDLIANENGGSRWEVYRYPQPYPSWVEHGESDWKSPVDYPEDGKNYVWDELNIRWVEYIE